MATNKSVLHNSFVYISAKLVFLLLAQSFFSSCASQDKFRAPDVERNVYVSDASIYSNSNIVDVSTRSTYSPRSDLYLTNEEMKAWGERTYVYELEKNIDYWPSKRDKHTKLLQEEKDRLQKAFETRMNERSEFLREFYNDLYHLNNKDFTKRYKKSCSDEVLKRLKFAYILHHGKKGYAWFIFTDNKIHDSKDFLFNYLDGNPAKVEDKDFAYFMFGDSIKQHLPKFRFYNEEDKWWYVKLGNNYMLVQVDGLGKHIKITGIVNPYLNVRIKAPKHEVNLRTNYYSPYGKDEFSE